MGVINWYNTKGGRAGSKVGGGIGCAVAADRGT